jgi:hypothetical protein
MRPEEADTLASWVLELGLPPGTVCLNIGSSTAEFREHDRPHIQNRFIGPLAQAGIRFVHCDMKQADGVDEVGDVFDADFQARLQAYDARLLVCSNLLEHLTEPEKFARVCANLVGEGAYGLFSVPSSYPYHPDPIDTMLRLKPDQLAAMLPEWSVVRASEMEAGSYWQDLKETGKPLRMVAHQAARVALPFYRPKQWLPNASRLSWLFRPYRVSVVLLKKAGDGSRAARS